MLDLTEEYLKMDCVIPVENVVMDITIVLVEDVAMLATFVGSKDMSNPNVQWV